MGSKKYSRPITNITDLRPLESEDNLINRWNAITKKWELVTAEEVEVPPSLEIDDAIEFGDESTMKSAVNPNNLDISLPNSIPVNEKIIDPLVEQNVVAFKFSPDGRFLYYCGTGNDRIHIEVVNDGKIFNLDSTIIADLQLTPHGITKPVAFIIARNGTRLYIVAELITSGAQLLFQFNLPTKNVIDNAVLVGSITLQDQLTTGIAVHPTGKFFFLVGQEFGFVDKFSVDTDWEILDNFSLVSQTNMSAFTSTMEDIFFSEIGNQMYILDLQNQKIIVFDLFTAWNTAIIHLEIDEEIDLSNLADVLTSLYIRPNLLQFWVVNTGDADVVVEFKSGLHLEGTLKVEGRISGVSNPLNITDATNQLSAGSGSGFTAQESAICASTVNLSDGVPFTDIDGVVPEIGTVVLLKDQDIKTENGLYRVSDSKFEITNWSRITEANTALKINGMGVFILQGMINRHTSWVMLYDIATIDSTGNNILFQKVSSMKSNGIMMMNYNEDNPANNEFLPINGGNASGSTNFFERSAPVPVNMELSRLTVSYNEAPSAVVSIHLYVDGVLNAGLSVSIPTDGTGQQHRVDLIGKATVTEGEEIAIGINGNANSIQLTGASLVYKEID